MNQNFLRGSRFKVGSFSVFQQSVACKKNRPRWKGRGSKMNHEQAAMGTGLLLD